ncbi:TAXI family TRAP transporter solute-binding subunit [Frankia tisae]|uniref:TAXI family TRAP transporter solute-binding subunit n=1 Tax=Frankia tisae TaxID=2950104 RepID=UPI0021BEACA7|nr:TAXI family TRAP transporter solute-binding subunit [Frankia tisae]
MSNVELSARGGRGYYRAIGMTLVVVAALAVVLGAQARPGSARRLGKCPVIDIFAGQGGSSVGARATPYDQYAAVIQRNIKRRYPGSAVYVVATPGSAFNVSALADSTASTCWLAFGGMGTSVDAAMAVYQFEGQRVTTVRTVGPLWLDFIQVVVRAPDGAYPNDRPMTELADLCQPNRVLETGPTSSGTERIGEILLHQLRSRSPTCNPQIRNSSLTDAVDAVRRGRADALLWSGGAPTTTIAAALRDPAGRTLTLLPLDEGYLKGMQIEWNNKYPALHGGDYRQWTLQRNDYAGLNPTYTIASSNVVLVNKAADANLVKFVADLLVTDRQEFEAALWGSDQKGRHFLDPKTEIEENQLYCTVTLHKAAADYYLSHLGFNRSCLGP